MCRFPVAAGCDLGAHLLPPLLFSLWVGALRSMVASLCLSTFIYVRETHSPMYFACDGLEPKLVVLSIWEVSCICILCLIVMPPSY